MQGDTHGIEAIDSATSLQLPGGVKNWGCFGPRPLSCLLLADPPGMLLCSAQAVQEFSWPGQATKNVGAFSGVFHDATIGGGIDDGRAERGDNGPVGKRGCG